MIISSCERTEGKSRCETMAKEIPYLLHFSALTVELLLSKWQGEETRAKQSDASAAETPRLLPKAGSCAHREVAPEETAYMTA